MGENCYRRNIKQSLKHFVIEIYISTFAIEIMVSQGEEIGHHEIDH